MSDDRREIWFNATPDPKLDPGSPDFDFELWKAARISAKEKMQKRLDEITQRLMGLYTPESTKAIRDAFSAIMEEVITSALGDTKEEREQITTALKGIITRLNELAREEDEAIDYGEQTTLFPEDEKELALQAEIYSALPRLQSIIPDTHLMPNNKLANTLTKDIIDAGAIDLIVSSAGKKEITTRCILSYEGDNVKLTSRQPFTEYDRTVSDAVTSLFEYGDSGHIVTAATVYRAMVHATETETPSPQQIGAVTRSLDKMRFVRVQIDCTDELTRRNISLNGAQITNGKIDTYLLNLKKIEVMAGGQKVTAYKVMDTPILYDYARLTNQVLNVPAALLDIRDGTGAKVSNTERRITIKSYLMRRISVMKGKTGNRQSRHIIYDTLFKEIGEVEPSRKDKQAIRDYIDLVLQSWTAQHFIKGYKTITSGRKYTGVEIIL